MEKLKNKHDHALTQWLKVIIFAILMLAPFFSVASKCLYVTCNKNAKDSYSDYTQITKTNYSLGTTFTSGDYVFVNYYGETSTGNYSTYNILNNQTNLYEVFNIDTNRDISFVQFQVSNGNYKLLIRTLINHETTANVTIDNWQDLNKPFYFIVSSGSYPSSQPFFNMSYNVYTNGTLDNAFEYSVNQLTQTPIFNWVQNTAIYTPINAMTSGLGFDSSNNVIAVLLAYWTLLTCLYVLFDIIISCFTKITHLISGNA